MPNNEIKEKLVQYNYMKLLINILRIVCDPYYLIADIRVESSFALSILSICKGGKFACANYREEDYKDLEEMRLRLEKEREREERRDKIRETEKDKQLERDRTKDSEPSPSLILTPSASLSPHPLLTFLSPLSLNSSLASSSLVRSYILQLLTNLCELSQMRKNNEMRSMIEIYERQRPTEEDESVKEDMERLIEQLKWEP
jgi:hypothetical protein